MVDWSSINWNVLIQAILFGLFTAGTAVLNVVLQPTYDSLVVPELSLPSLFPSIAHPGASAGFLSTAVQFSEFLLSNLVDPAIALVLVALGGLYLFRSFSARMGAGLDPLLPRLVIALLGANFTVPLAAAALELAGSVFRLISSFDGGAWRHWTNLVPAGGILFSWDNGVLAFVVTFALFALVLALAALVALRDALIAVLLVLLPIFTLLWALPPLASLARRGWTLLVELAFLPAVILIPLELAVGAPTVLLVLGYLAIAVGSPYLISISRAQLGGMGFPSAGGALTGGLQRGLAVASLSAQGSANALAPGASATGRAAQVGAAVRGVASHLGKGPLPAGVALSAGHLVSQGSRQLLQHIRHFQGTHRSVPGHPAQQVGFPRPPAGGQPG
ncbi:MAG: hypothetical protein L3K14_02020 [Thermoplasmata archaeon]|nr:hypothetical protein [Thermoplasmata archaeon]